MSPKRMIRALLVIAFLLSLLPGVALAADDWDVSNGHFFTQTGGGTGKGYVVNDEGGITFWSEFKRLGGVQAVGYPASQRFTWDGFTVQVFQRVIFQWRPDSKSVAFVNVFDRLSQLGKDEWLLQIRQTPKPIQMNEQGFTWDQIVKGRLALIDAYPAIKAKYYDVVGDPIQANGLPTSAVIDMGNHYALRCQRVVFQLWKEDVPWAKKGQVTVALGGDISKETGILPDAAALLPTGPDGIGTALPTAVPTAVPTSTAPSTQWALHDDAEKSFKYPAGWRGLTLWTYDGRYAFNYYVDGPGTSVDAYIIYMAPFKMGSNYNLKEWFAAVARSLYTDPVAFAELEDTTINGYQASMLRYGVKGDFQAIAVAIKRGANVYYVGGLADEDKWSRYEPLIMESIRSYVPKQG